MSRLLTIALYGGLCGALSACATDVLPSTEQQRGGAFESYEIAEIAYRLIQPGVTTTEKLSELGIDPQTTPNLRVMNYVEVMRLFMPSEQVALRDLDPAVQGCIGARTACIGYALNPEQTSTQRTGHVSLDVLGFSRETQESGWAASMLLLIVDGVVVYKLWSGTPKIEGKRRETNPLGPAQDLSGKARDAIPKP